MVLIILLIPIGLWTASFLLDQPVLVTDITVEGRYYNLYDNNGYIEFYEEKRQYYHGSYIRKKENESMYSIEDTYRVEGNKVILSNLIIRKDIEYLVYNNYLIQRDLAFKNTIPKGKTFNVSCIRNNIKYVFNKDGSFSKVKVNNDRETTELSGLTKEMKRL